MICDLLDYYSPTMCIVGSRGLGSLKGILLGSTSHYLVQKSPVPCVRPALSRLSPLLTRLS
jgi:nucleotide-binding universal stress UspA family protein